jgi:hypothetical protein
LQVVVEAVTPLVQTGVQVVVEVEVVCFIAAPLLFQPTQHTLFQWVQVAQVA